MIVNKYYMHYFIQVTNHGGEIQLQGNYMILQERTKLYKCSHKSEKISETKDIYP